MAGIVRIQQSRKLPLAGCTWFNGGPSGFYESAAIGFEADVAASHIKRDIYTFIGRLLKPCATFFFFFFTTVS